MRRRRYLALCAGSAGVLAGCSDGSADGETASNGEVYEEAFREALTSEGIEILAFAVDGGDVELVYEPPEPTEEGVEESIDVTARAFFDRVYGGWEVERLDSTVEIDGSVIATWRMRREWIEQYLSGEISREELGAKVEASVERHDDAE